MKIDTTFNLYSDAKDFDPDSNSPVLRNYHQLLWSKTLPSGSSFDLCTKKKGVYLYHKSTIGEFFLGSDAITHSYKNHKRKNLLLSQIPNEVNVLFEAGSTIGAYIIFPNDRKYGAQTINQARGINSLIDDRFDLTLECIRLFYLNERSPLYDTLLRYKDFFKLFDSFIGYVKFFLLEDLIDSQNMVKFYLPFDEFKTRPAFSNIKEYLLYKENVINFIKLRNKRIEQYSDSFLEFR